MPKDSPPQTPTPASWTFEDLQSLQGIHQLEQTWQTHLQHTDPSLLTQLQRYRTGQWSPEGSELSAWLIQLSLPLERFLLTTFSQFENHNNPQPFEKNYAQQQSTIASHMPIAFFKKNAVKKALKKTALPTDPSFAEAHQALLDALKQHGIATDDLEWAVATLYEKYHANLESDPAYAERAEHIHRWCRLAAHDPQGLQITQHWVSFQLPERLDPMTLVSTETFDLHNTQHQKTPHSMLRKRDGFDLTDPRMDVRGTVAEADYCVDCHEQAGDFCSTGFPVKKKQKDLGLKSNALGETLTGCPVEEKISEMHWLYKRTHLLAAFAMIMRDNPLCALTGHRICNECMKACIYQKQTPVNIPQTETSILSQILNLPWGVEIYDLLMRWNPLRANEWQPEDPQNKSVLVMGMGPAGISLAHHLLMAGHTVVGMDGLKIETLPEKLLTQPIPSFEAIKDPLSKRTTYGFGGVAEYGITVRWDKNFLKLIQIIMMRRPHFQVHGGVRFGGTLTIEDAWRLGFDHLAIAVGAGLPKALPIPGALAPGVRQANDFLMALQLTGAHQADSIVDLQIHLPAVVIGGGLTGVDTATEVQAYYIMQVERILKRYEWLCDQTHESHLTESFKEVHPEHLQTFLAHGRAVRSERQRAEAAGEAPNFIPLLQQWGGVTIVYRRRMQDSPAYRRNHEELIKALEEGIFYAECLSPQTIQLDAHGHAAALVCQPRHFNEASEWETSDTSKTLPAQSILVATGSEMNVAYAFEHKGSLERAGYSYQAYASQNAETTLTPAPQQTTTHCKTPNVAAFTSYSDNGYRVSFLGDTHPVFHGNVIKAIASGQKIAPQIIAHLQHQTTPKTTAPLLLHIRQQFTCTVLRNECLAPNMQRLTLHAPWLVKQHQLGQFYRLQNFETQPIMLHGKSLRMQALTVMPTHLDREKGEMQCIIPVNDSASSMLTPHLQVGTTLSMMGPNGNKLHAPHDQDICFIGDHTALIQLLAMGEALQQTGNRLHWVATDSTLGLFEMERLTKWLDTIVCISDASTAPAHWPTDTIYAKDWDEAFSSVRQSSQKTVSTVYVSAPSEIIRELQHWRQGKTHAAINPDAQWVAHIQTPMQCMLKGVCAQCLVWQKDPVTGQRTKSVYACSWHQQPMTLVDPDGLMERQLNHQVTAVLNRLWILNQSLA